MTERFAAARAAVASCLREAALLPPFPLDERSFLSMQSESEEVPAPVVCVVATDRVRGQVLPRSEDVWLALRPFHDITKTTLEAWKSALLRRRMAAVALLVRLASSHTYRFDAMIDCGTNKTPDHEPEPAKSFWWDLFQALDVGATQPRSNELQRNLVVLSRTGGLRFLFCVDSDASQVDFAGMLEEFLTVTRVDLKSNTGGNALDEVLEVCGLPKVETSRVDVEIGLSFAAGRISQALATKLVDVIKKHEMSGPRADGIRFRITSLRFGKNCVVQPKALELLGQNWHKFSEISSAALGSMDGIKPASLREGLLGITQSLGIQRLVTNSACGFDGVASSFRNNSASSITEVDATYEPTTENAAWLAFAFFHVDAKSSVSSIRLRGAIDPKTGRVDPFHFSPEWLETFKRVLMSQNARENLAELDDDDEIDKKTPEKTRHIVKLKSQTPVKIHPLAGTKLLCKIDSEDTEFEVLGAIKNSFGIVVPGLGVGWVPSTATISSRNLPTSVNFETPRTNRRIRALTIDRGQLLCSPGPRPKSELISGHLHTLMELLDIIGEPLESLHLPDARLETHHLEHILMRCPNLKELNVSGNHILNMSPVVDDYENGKCKISTLSIAIANNFVLGPDLRQVVKLFQSNRDGPLRQLMMSFSSRKDYAGDRTVSAEDIAEPLEMAFRSAKHLEFVQLTRVTGDFDAADSLALSMPPDTISDPLSHRSKLALLSAVKIKSKSDDDPVGKFDSNILGVILAFSRQAVTRHLIRFAVNEMRRCKCQTDDCRPY